MGEVVEKGGRIDICVNVIGIGYVQGAPMIEMKLEQFTRGITDVMQTQFLTMTAAGRQMSRQGSGVILAITATPAGRFVATNTRNFGVASAAIANLCRQMAGELGPPGERVVR